MDNIINLLEIKHVDRIGSSTDKKLKYSNDVDLEEYLIYSGDLNDILKTYQEKFDKAMKTKNVWITDFKCGEDKDGEPYRWGYDDIMRGYQIVKNKKIYFVDQLHKKSIIKLDIVALIGKRLVEFSNNYYYRIGETDTEPYLDSVFKSLIWDAIQYQHEGMYYKSLKRIFAYYQLFKDMGVDILSKQIEEEQGKLRKLFNSNVGKLYTSVNGLGTIALMLEQRFKPVSEDIIVSNLDIIKSKLPPKYHYIIDDIIKDKPNRLSRIESAKKMLNGEVNIALFEYLKTDKINISPISIYSNAQFGGRR